MIQGGKEYGLQEKKEKWQEKKEKVGEVLMKQKKKFWVLLIMVILVIPSFAIAQTNWVRPVNITNIYQNGSNVSGNPFDQDLNTTSNVSFNWVNSSTYYLGSDELWLGLDGNNILAKDSSGSNYFTVDATIDTGIRLKKSGVNYWNIRNDASNSKYDSDSLILRGNANTEMFIVEQDNEFYMNGTLLSYDNITSEGFICDINGCIPASSTTIDCQDDGDCIVLPQDQSYWVFVYNRSSAAIPNGTGLQFFLNLSGVSYIQYAINNSPIIQYGSDGNFIAHGNGLFYGNTTYYGTLINNNRIMWKQSDYEFNYNRPLMVETSPNTAGKIKFGNDASYIEKIAGPMTIMAGNELRLVPAIGTPTVHIGNGSNQDYLLNFYGDSNQGKIYFLEDEDYFEIQDDTLLSAGERLYIRDTDSYIGDTGSGYVVINPDHRLSVLSNSVYFGKGQNQDIDLFFNAVSNDGYIYWMEDEDYFRFNDDILMQDSERIYFDQTTNYITGSNSDDTHFFADSQIFRSTTGDPNLIIRADDGNNSDLLFQEGAQSKFYITRLKDSSGGDWRLRLYKNTTDDIVNIDPLQFDGDHGKALADTEWFFYDGIDVVNGPVRLRDDERLDFGTGRDYRMSYDSGDDDLEITSDGGVELLRINDTADLTIGDTAENGTIRIRDTDEAGWTCCTALNGVLSCAIC